MNEDYSWNQIWIDRKKRKESFLWYTGLLLWNTAILGVATLLQLPEWTEWMRDIMFILVFILLVVGGIAQLCFTHTTE
jgi:hypothetical protein